MVTKIKFPWNYAEALPVRKRGYALIQDPLLNKSSAFTTEEREVLELRGMLPTQVNSIHEQANRIYPRVHKLLDPLEKYVALASLQDRNEHLYFRVLCDHITEFMPVVYTPTVGLASRNFSNVFQRGRGLWITPGMRGKVRDIIGNAVRERYITLIVVTDNEAILGIGDQGAGGMAISIGKLSLYTACAGIHPGSVLPVSLDVGTDNELLLNDPLYLGWRQPRLRGREYDALLEEFVSAVADCFPGTVIQWEDFSKDNALKILDRYRKRVPSFNDDIQGTGAVALAGILSACRVKQESLREQRIVIHGAGAAGLGLARQIRAGLLKVGVPEERLGTHLALLDSRGLLVDDQKLGHDYKRELAWPAAMAKEFGLEDPADRGLQAVVERYKPTVLIGTSGQAGAFNEEIVKIMAKLNEQPVIMPFSNPTDITEAYPVELYKWTDGRVLVATGSPFEAVEYGGRTYEVGQGNNVFIFPGLGLGALLSEARIISDNMISAAAYALADAVTDEELQRGLLFPSVERLRSVAASVAEAVIRQAQEEELCMREIDDVSAYVAKSMWEPAYPAYVAIT